MGRSLAILLTEAGCSVATCDVSAAGLAETEALCLADLPADTLISTHVADVSDETALVRFRDEAQAAHGRTSAELVFLNAGIAGGGSMLESSREEWERCFNICWGGVYLGTRTFLPMLVAAEQGRLVNTSSVNGFWASLGPAVSHTAYSSAKFAVKGLSEALITDLRLTAPHVEVSVVMPGHIGTGIVENTVSVHGDDLTEEAKALSHGFRNGAPMNADQAAQAILDAVLRGEWRILVGDDAVALDQAVRANPTAAYDPDFGAAINAEDMVE